MAAEDFSGVNTIGFDVYSSRTGSNLKFGIHDTGGTTTEITPNITSANAWQSIAWDISGVADADKNAIDTFIITVANADSANTFYVDNFITSVSVDVSPATLTFTATLNAPTYGIGINVTPTTLNMTAMVNAVVIGHSVVVPGETLSFTLYNPSVHISSSVSPAKLTLTGTLEGGVPFLATRMIRRNYTFGVTEQVTHTKLNNLADTAIWEISNQVTGDMFYYEGTDPDPWKRIAPGTAGQVLTINASGQPRWA